MARKRFRWTRRRYEKARELARFMDRHLCELPDQMRAYAKAAVLAEREACAKVCDIYVKRPGSIYPSATAYACAAAIRARRG